MMSRLHTASLASIGKDIADQVGGDGRMKRLMTVKGGFEGLTR